MGFIKNKDYEIEIIDVTATGEGVGKKDGQVMFIPDTAPGDVVLAKAVKVNKNLAYGKLLEVIKASDDRVIPKCNVCKRCGGCSLMHISYEGQLKLKQKQVRDAMERIGGFDNVTVHEVSGCDNPYHYRNKTQIPVGESKNGGIVFGFYAKHSHDIVPAGDCVVAQKCLSAILSGVARYMRANNVKPYNEETHKGVIRHIFLRSDKYDNVMVVCVINADSLPNEDEFIECVREKYDKVVSIVVNVNKKKTNLIMGDKNTVIFGTDKLCDEIGDLKLSLSPNSFYQINRLQTEKLYSKGKELLDLKGDETVFDLYSGIGSIGLFMADKAKKIIGVEIVEDAVKNARENAAFNRIENAEYYHGAAEDVVPELYEKGERADVVILDPPRKGADKVLIDTVLKMEPSKILYISCNPATLARDLKEFTKDGKYTFDTVYPYDLFAHTTHVETITLLQKRSM